MNSYFNNIFQFSFKIKILFNFCSAFGCLQWIVIIKWNRKPIHPLSVICLTCRMIKSHQLFFIVLYVICLCFHFDCKLWDVYDDFVFLYLFFQDMRRAGEETTTQYCTV